MQITKGVSTRPVEHPLIGKSCKISGCGELVYVIVHIETLYTPIWDLRTMPDNSKAMVLVNSKVGTYIVVMNPNGWIEQFELKGANIKILLPGKEDDT